MNSYSPDFQDEEKETSHPTTRDLYEEEGSAAQCLSPTSPTELQSTGQGTCSSEYIFLGGMYR